EAWNSPVQHFWAQAIKDEVKALQINNTWDPVPGSILFGLNPIGSKWVFKTKENPDGTTRYKARLVIKGFKQQYGIDYTETYASVGRLDTLRILLALAAEQDLKLHHLDIVTTFLNPCVDQDHLYMLLPPGIQYADASLQEFQTVRFQKALYGLK